MPWPLPLNYESLYIIYNKVISHTKMANGRKSGILHRPHGYHASYTYVRSSVASGPPRCDPVRSGVAQFDIEWNRLEMGCVWWAILGRYRVSKAHRHSAVWWVTEWSLYIVIRTRQATILWKFTSDIHLQTQSKQCARLPVCATTKIHCLRTQLWLVGSYQSADLGGRAVTKMRTRTAVHKQTYFLLVQA